MNAEQPKQKPNYVALGISMGTAIGVSVGTAVGMAMDNLAMGISNAKESE